MQLSRPRWAHVRREGDGRWSVLATVLAALCTLVALVAVLLHAVPTSWQPTVALTSVAHQPMWLAPAAIVLALLARRWATLVVALLVGALVLVVQVPPAVSADPPANAVPLTVMQANLRLGNADPAAIVKLVREHKVEVLATEELTEQEEGRLVAAGLSTLLPYRYTVASTPNAGNGIGMWSRYPLSDEVRYPDFELKVISAHVEAPTGEYTFVAVHIEPPWPDPPGEWTRELSRLKGVLAGLPTDTPLIAAGDFNATVDHSQFRALLQHGVADAADQAGAGYDPSYPADRWFGPVIAIDHVLTRHAVATSLSTVDLPNSDHRGLLVHVALDPT